MVLFRIVIPDLLHICVVFFVRFLHNRSVLLINPGVLCEEKDFVLVGKNLKKDVLKCKYF